MADEQELVGELHELVYYVREVAEVLEASGLGRARHKARLDRAADQIELVAKYLEDEGA